MKKIYVLLVLTFLYFPVFSLEVDRIELESAGDETSVIFVNYEGPHDIINSASEIESIGSGISLPISEDTEAPQTVGDPLRYSIIHAVDPENPTGLDADILILGDEALVDHIDNVRRIIAGYLQSAYGYTPEDSRTIAVFATVYNAVYRGQLDVFAERYKSVVMENLTAERVGISLNYEDWPGNTQIVIPLSSLEGGLGTVDTSVISDSEVIESMQEDPDMGIEERKQLVEIKEEEALIAEENAREAQREATVARQDVVEERVILEEVVEEAVIAQQVADENPDDPVAQEQAVIAQERVVEQEAVVVEAQQRVTDLEQESEEQQTIADIRRTDAQSDRIEIAADQQEIMDAQEALGNETLTLTYALKIVDERRLLSALVLIDTKTGLEVKESPVNVIRNRIVYPEGSDYVAVAGTTGRNAAVRLVKLDSLSMEIVQQSVETLSLDSMLVKEDDHYFVIVEEDDNFYLGKFDTNLQIVTQSSIEVIAQSPITITESGIMVNDVDGIVKLLDKESLELVKVQ